MTMPTVATTAAALPPVTSKNHNLSVAFSGLPAELRSVKRWLVWAYGPPAAPGKKPRKEPYNPKTAHKTDATRCAGWTLAEARAAYLARPDFFAGVGFALRRADGFVAVDLDDCAPDGQPSAEAWRVIRLVGSYAELSPSGRGVRIICRASVAAALVLPGIEIYGAARYVTLTGRHIEGAPTSIRAAQGAIDALYAEHSRSSQEAKRPDVELPDEAEVTRYYRARLQLLAPSGLPHGINPDSQTGMALRAVLTDDERQAQALVDAMCRKWPFLSGYLLKPEGGYHRHMLRAIVMRGLKRFAGYPYPAAAALFWHYFRKDAKQAGRGTNWLRGEIGRVWNDAPEPPNGYRSVILRSDERADDAGESLTVEAEPRSRSGRPAAVDGPAAYLARLVGDVDAGGVLLASQAELAERYGLSRRTVMRYETTLADAGQLERTTVRKGRRSHSFVRLVSCDKPLVTSPQPAENAAPAVVTNSGALRVVMPKIGESPQCIGNTTGFGPASGPEGGPPAASSENTNRVPSPAPEAAAAADAPPSLADLARQYLDAPPSEAGRRMVNATTGVVTYRRDKHHFAGVVAGHGYDAPEAHAAYEREQQRREHAERDALWRPFYAWLNAAPDVELLAYIGGRCKAEVHELAQQHGTPFDTHLYRTRLRKAKEAADRRGLVVPDKRKRAKPAAPALPLGWEWEAPTVGAPKPRRAAVKPVFAGTPTATPTLTNVDMAPAPDATSLLASLYRRKGADQERWYLERRGVVSQPGSLAAD